MKNLVNIMATTLVLSVSVHAKISVPPTSLSKVRVRLASAQTRIDLQGWSLNHQNLEFLPVSLPHPSQRLSIRRIALNQRGQQVWLWKIAEGERTDLSSSPFLQISGDGLRAEGFGVAAPTLPAQVLLTAGRGSHADRFDIVGVLPIEDYLVGVLAGEVPASWPMEALKAQATAARSYTLSIMRERAHQPFQLDSDTRDQMFRLWDPGHRGLDRIRQAVLETKGLFLQSGKGDRPLKAFYHADCGGHLHAEQNVWANSKTETTGDAACPDHPHQHWGLDLSSASLDAIVAQGFHVPERQVQSIEKRNDPKFGSESIEVHFADGTSSMTSSNQFRGWIGFDKLKSTSFRVSKASPGSSWKFVGVGFGHGVGLCQTGARALADQRKNFRDILKLYFPGSRLVTVGENASINR